MGLSAEPVVKGVMVPRIKELMESSIWASWPKHPLLSSCGVPGCHGVIRGARGGGSDGPAD